MHRLTSKLRSIRSTWRTSLWRNSSKRSSFRRWRGRRTSNSAPEPHNKPSNNECTRMSWRTATGASWMDSETNKRCTSRFKWLSYRARHNWISECVKFRRFKMASWGRWNSNNKASIAKYSTIRKLLAGSAFSNLQVTCPRTLHNLASGPATHKFHQQTPSWRPIRSNSKVLNLTLPLSNM